jgi:hypothetical protein
LSPVALGVDAGNFFDPTDPPLVGLFDYGSVMLLHGKGLRGNYDIKPVANVR